jgi:hypothetical protein
VVPAPEEIGEFEIDLLDAAFLDRGSQFGY